MWPFIKKERLPGIKRDLQGKLIFELTEEENREVEKVFAMFKRPDGEFVVKKEVADEIEKGMIAMGLFNCAKDQIIQSEFDSNKGKKMEFIDRAIASVAKAYTFCPLPIYMYDMACFMEMNGRNNEARTAFRSFLELQEKFRPSQIQEVLLDSQQRDVDEAIKDAKAKA